MGRKPKHKNYRGLFKRNPNIVFSEINYCSREIRKRWYKKGKFGEKNKFVESETMKIEIKTSPNN